MGSALMQDSLSAAALGSAGTETTAGDYHSLTARYLVLDFGGSDCFLGLRRRC